MELGTVYSFPDPKVNVMSGAEPLSVQFIAPVPASAPMEAQILSTEAGSSFIVSQSLSLNPIFRPILPSKNRREAREGGLQDFPYR